MSAIRRFLDKIFGRGRDPITVQQPIDETADPARYHQLPGTLQFSPGAKQPVDKTEWKPCESCRRAVPVQPDHDGQFANTGTWTYVCPFCSHCHVGTPSWSEDDKKQEACHECGAILGEAYQCPKCSFPRGWMRVVCPYCENRQPVLAPHWVEDCDTFRLECVRCESVFRSLCIC